jgi:hypothetical protein
VIWRCRDNVDAVAEGGRLGVEPVLEHRLGASFDHVQQARRAGAVADRGEVDDHGDVPVAAAGVPPTVLIDADHVHVVVPVRVVDEYALAFSKYGVVGGVPRDPEALGDTGDSEVGEHDAFQCPAQPPARQLARGSAAALVPWRHTCPQPVQR